MKKTANESHTDQARLAETVGEISVVYTDRQAQYEQAVCCSMIRPMWKINDGAKTTKTYDYPYFTLQKMLSGSKA